MSSLNIYFMLGMGAPYSAQGLLRGLYLGTTPGSVGRLYGILGMQPDGLCGNQVPYSCVLLLWH